MKGIIIGGGGATRELLRRLGETWELTIVDSSKDRLDQVKTVRAVRIVLGDGTSRLVLERAGLKEADALVAATNDDDANLEACRLALEQGVHRVVAVAANPERLGQYRDLGVPASSPDRLLARRLEEGLESRRITSQSFARGKAEAIEFEVSHSSPVRGRSLKELRPRSWIVGTVLRGQELLVPHGDTVFEEGDLVTVLGAGADFAEIVRTFTSGQSRFPLDYGKSVALAGTPRNLEVLGEATYLVRHSRAASLLLVHRDPKKIRDEDEAKRVSKLVEQAAHEAQEAVEVHQRAVPGKPLRSLEEIPSTESVGVVVRTPSRRGGLFALWDTSRAVRFARRIHRPVLLARGSHPYRRILVPARRTDAGRAAARAAIDLAVKGKAALTALAAVDPVFLVGPEASTDARAAIGWMREESAVLGLHLDGRVERGNPVRLFLDAAREHDLLVLGVGTHRTGLFPLAIVDHVTARARISVLLVPVQEEQD